MGKVKSLIYPTIDFLIKKAGQRNLTTYSEIANHIETHPRVVPKILWEIDSMRLNRNLPPVTAIVTRKDSSIPGDNFLNYLCPGEKKKSRLTNGKMLFKKYMIITGIIGNGINTKYSKFRWCFLLKPCFFKWSSPNLSVKS